MRLALLLLCFLAAWAMSIVVAASIATGVSSRHPLGFAVAGLTMVQLWSVVYVLWRNR